MHMFEYVIVLTSIVIGLALTHLMQDIAGVIQQPRGYDGFKDYFLARRFWFFGLLLGWSAIDMLDTWIKGTQYFASLGVDTLVGTGIVATVCILGMTAGATPLKR